MNPVLDYVEEKGWEYRISGKELIIKDCPYCGKRDWKFYINQDSRVFLCFHASCAKKGHISKLKEHVGDVIKIEGLPKPVSDVDFQQLVDNCHMLLLENEMMLRYLDDHGITLEAINRFKLGIRKVSKNLWLLYPSMVDGVPQYIKYRLLPFEKELSKLEKESGLTKFKREKGAPSILFNQDALDSFDDIIVTEGERDAITLLMAGYENVVGTTGGAQTLLPEWFDVLKDKEKIYLVFDADEAGQKGAKESWASRLGYGKCYNVTLPDGLDITEYFMEGHTTEEFNELLGKAQVFNIPGVRSILSILRSMSDNPQEEQYFPTPWSNANRLLGGGMRKGELLTLSAPPGVGKCVHEDSLVVDPASGDLLFVKDAVKNKIPTTLSESNYIVSEHQVADWVDSGVQECLCVRTKLGYEIITTRNHKFFSLFNKEIEAANLSVGNCISVVKSFSLNNEKKNIDIALVKILAYMIADGSLSNNFDFTNSDPIVIEDMRQCVEYYDGELVLKETRKNFTPSYRLVGKTRGSNFLRDYFKEINLFGIKSKDKFIPTTIFRQSKNNISVFVSCLWQGDGWVIYDEDECGKSQVGFSSSSKLLVYQLRHLLLRFGVIGQVRRKKVKYKGNFVPSWVLEIRDRKNLIRFYKSFELMSYKRDLLRLVYEQSMANKNNHDSHLGAYPKELWGYIKDKCKKKNITMKELSERCGRGSRFRAKHNFKFHCNISEFLLDKISEVLNDDYLKSLVKGDILLDEVIAIEDVGKQRVFDLSVPSTKRFIANDIIVHNTTMSLQMASLLAFKMRVPTLIFCMEMNAEQLVRIFVSQCLDKPWVEFRREDALFLSMQFEDVPIYFGYSPRIKPLQVQQTFLEARDRFGIEFFVFDNLHTLIREHDNVVERIGAASKMFKDLAMETNTMVMLIAQPRKMEKEEVMHYYVIKGSSDIPADSDIVCLLHRNRTKEIKEPESVGDYDVGYNITRVATFEDKTRFIVDKVRESAGGECRLRFDGRFRQFYSEED